VQDVGRLVEARLIDAAVFRHRDNDERAPRTTVGIDGRVVGHRSASRKDAAVERPTSTVDEDTPGVT
jgi:hypothetical protein